MLNANFPNPDIGDDNTIERRSILGDTRFGLRARNNAERVRHNRRRQRSRGCYVPKFTHGKRDVKDCLVEAQNFAPIQAYDSTDNGEDVVITAISNGIEDMDEGEAVLMAWANAFEEDLDAQLAYYDELEAEFAEPEEPDYRAEGALYENDRYEELELAEPPRIPPHQSYPPKRHVVDRLWVLLGFKNLEDAEFMVRRAEWQCVDAKSPEELELKRLALQVAETTRDERRESLLHRFGRTIMAPIRREHTPCRQSPWKDRKAPRQWARHQPRHRSTIPPIEVINTRAAWIEEQEAVVEIIIRAMFVDEPDVLPRGTPIELALELAAA
ncbi:hypothetical protein HYW18_03605 [Candidatus Uhrbacteria bacterium]|nr:hypothetical protein [Candidatus Uhrbacteria bacterium]